MIRGVDLPGLLADLSHALDLTGAACAGRAELFDNVTDPAAVAYRLNQARGTARQGPIQPCLPPNGNRSARR